MPAAFTYRLFGLTLSSAIELPELIPAASCEVPDVVIELGKVASQGGADQTPQPIEGGSVIDVEGVARFAIRGGKRITVDALAGAPGRNVRLYLLGSVMGMLLHQRGILPLHANAVEIGGKAFAFMGPSGAGKSTLAAWFHDEGHHVIADDVCVVSLDEKARPVVHPGLPRLRLWKDALEGSGRTATHYTASYVGEESCEKYDVPLFSESAHGNAAEEYPLVGVYVLERGEAFTIVAASGSTSFEAISANMYRGEYAGAAGQLLHNWSLCVQLARNVTVFIVTRRWGHDLLDGEARALLSHASTMPAKPA